MFRTARFAEAVTRGGFPSSVPARLERGFRGRAFPVGLDLSVAGASSRRDGARRAPKRLDDEGVSPRHSADPEDVDCGV